MLDVPKSKCNKVCCHNSHQSPSKVYWHDGLSMGIGSGRGHVSQVVCRVAREKHEKIVDRSPRVRQSRGIRTSFVQFTREKHENLEGHIVMAIIHTIQSTDMDTSTRFLNHGGETCIRSLELSDLRRLETPPPKTTQTLHTYRTRSSQQTACIGTILGSTDK
jgi:hypothetical protein